MGQQVAFIILIILGGMILFQILILHKNEKQHTDWHHQPAPIPIETHHIRVLEMERNRTK